MAEKLTASDVKRSLQTRITEQGTLEEFYRFTFKVSDGTVQHVDIAKDRFNSDAVVAAIQNELEAYQATKDAFG